MIGYRFALQSISKHGAAQFPPDEGMQASAKYSQQTFEALGNKFSFQERHRCNDRTLVRYKQVVILDAYHEVHSRLFILSVHLLHTCKRNFV